MYLKSLTLRGFKSFASATTLNFEPGITCVVGPNGSGKSNVVDALSWVMGEQGAKSLRGGKMEDVIFAGTHGRAPLGRAEVELRIDNTDGALPIEYTEVTISRTMFRNGGSEYAINGHSARLLDVQELLSDSGIGRQMHVIVGQGQLDTILQATPEQRRGFIEEAAGVLKHRKRKERAVRKLEACEGNLTRLADLITEIRRQLRPLGRQAEVARRAAVVQAEVRDAKARIFADDLVQLQLAIEADIVDAEAARRHRAEIEAALTTARAEEEAAEQAVAACTPRQAIAQETWFGLAALAERVDSTISIARERVRNAGDEPAEVRSGRDPDELESQAEAAAAAEERLAGEVAELTAALAAATSERTQAEQAQQQAEAELATLARAAADRRESLARLTGQVNALRSRAAAGVAEIGRLTAAHSEALGRAEQARRAFASLETTVAGLDDGELGLDSAYEDALTAKTAVETELAELRRAEQTANQQRAAHAARLDALRIGLQRKDAASALLAAADSVEGLVGLVSALVSVRPGAESAIAAALGWAADAIAVTGVDEALAAVSHLKAADLGRAGLLLSLDAATTEGPTARPHLAGGAEWALDLVSAPPEFEPTLARALDNVVVVADLVAARELVDRWPELTAVTQDGDLLGLHFVAGGSTTQPSQIELQAAVEEAERQLQAVVHDADRLRFALTAADQRLQQADEAVAASLARLHESDAAQAALAEELGQLGSTSKSAHAEAERLAAGIARAEQARDADLSGLAELERRLAGAEQQPMLIEPDPAVRDEQAAVAQQARAAEMEARLALRTLEERVRAASGRAESLRRTARQERAARAKAQARRERILRSGQIAAAVQSAAERLAEQIATSLRLAAADRAAAEADRAEAQQRLAQVRSRLRGLSQDFEAVVDSSHREEMARTEQRLRHTALVEKAMAELGLDPQGLVDDYGPDRLVPVLTRPDGAALGEDDEIPEPVPYLRKDQEQRLRRAERALAALGRVNPLALDEFDAMQERHRFLAEQLEDLKQTRADLRDIIVEVDNRVERVFAEAYADVEAAFGKAFSRLFPGGEGRLVLTEPGNWLATGVDVEARPPGKKVKRLSLLSGGERSLVAVAFLVALFIARPSPFYILDEVEAALDDTNLGRLLEIYAELRDSSQLLVITHQKRTMEIADALYGVTMRGDGVSTVISQRLREPASVG